MSHYSYCRTFADFPKTFQQIKKDQTIIGALKKPSVSFGAAASALPCSSEPEATSSPNTTQPKTDEQIYEATIRRVPGESHDNNLILLVAHYLVGHDIIKLISQGGFGASDRKWIKDAVRQRLIGLEVVARGIAIDKDIRKECNITEVSFLLRVCRGLLSQRRCKSAMSWLNWRR